MTFELDESKDSSAQKEEAANLDEQKAMNEAVLGADRAQNVPVETTEETKPEDKSGEKTEDKAEEKKEEKKVEEEKKTSETKAPQSEDEKDIEKILEQFKGDKKEVAKGYKNLRDLYDRLGREVGEKRQIEAELLALKKRLEDEPEVVAKELMTKKQMTEGNLLDQVIQNPDVLPTYIKSEIEKGISGFLESQKLETALEEQYPGYKDAAKKAQVEDLDRLIKAGKVPLKEVLVWATDGYQHDTKVEEIKKVLKQEMETAQATKAGETVDKQGVVTGEKPEEEEDEGKVYQKTLIELER
jgi:hypothetical protein